ncbi:unnamed protein product [Effrenium voratum]|uniref:Uncharacterized protein n=1 Tax=Effrenium voratum TaxID=2562239 RepID=A0AA36MUA3_9DINO|nr:unnamed protein product [Effrenium voratum]
MWASAAEAEAEKRLLQQQALQRGKGLYQVNPQVTSYHNLRAAPSVFSPIVGTLEAYDVIEVSQTIQLASGDGTEFWAQLLRRSAGPAPWALIADDGVYLRKLLRPGDAWEKPKDWVPAAEEEEPYGEAAQSARSRANELADKRPEHFSLPEFMDLRRWWPF